MEVSLVFRKNKNKEKDKGIKDFHNVLNEFLLQQFKNDSKTKHDGFSFSDAHNINTPSSKNNCFSVYFSTRCS